MTGEPLARATRWVDPRDLITRANVRAVAVPDPELVASVRVHGVLQPPVVYEDGDQLVLLAGHRRTAAAIAAGRERIEVVVGPRLDEADRVAAQVSENTNRAGLRVVEVASAVAQMTLLGVPAGQIAKAAGLRAAQVAAARAVAEADARVSEAIIDAPDLTLEQAAALTDWGQDPDAVADLLAAAELGPVAFEHQRARLESRRETEQAYTAAAAEWTARGYQVLPPDVGGKLPTGAGYVRDLATADGTRLATGYYGVTAEHAACAGRAVLISTWRPESVQEVCTDPKGNGHTRAPAGYAGTAAPREQADRAEVIARNKDFKAATTVRHAHLGAFIRAGRFSQALVTAVHVHLLTHPRALDTPRGALFGTLTDFTTSGATTTETAYGTIQRGINAGAPANRVTGLLLAHIAEAGEKALAESTWRHPNPSAADWLKLLVAHTGYQLADIETTAVTRTDPTWTPPPATASAVPAAARAVSSTGRARGRGRATGT